MAGAGESGFRAGALPGAAAFFGGVAALARAPPFGLAIGGFAALESSLKPGTRE
jgi:hypothetical protein